MFHTSPNKEIKIDRWGIAGSCLFFSEESYFTSNASIYVFEMEEVETIEAWELYDEKIVEGIARNFECDEIFAERLLQGKENEWDCENCTADLSWWLQGQRGECAVLMGYEGCDDSDEQGPVTIVPMMGRESELKLVKILDD